MGAKCGCNMLGSTCWMQHVGGATYWKCNMLDPFEKFVGWSTLDKFDWQNFLLQHPSNHVEQTVLDDV